MSSPSRTLVQDRSACDASTDHANSSFELMVYTKIEEIASMRETWEELLELSFANRAFGSWSWYYHSLVCRPTHHPFLVAAYQEDSLCGLLPLSLDPAKRSLVFPHILADYHDVICIVNKKELPDLLWNKAVSSVDSGYGCTFQKLRDNGSLLGVLRPLAPVSMDEQQCSYIQLPSTYNDFLISKSRQFRKKLKRSHRDLKSAGITVGELKWDSSMGEYIPVLLAQLNEYRFKEESCFKRPGVFHFISSLLPDLFHSGFIRVFTLKEGALIKALDICVVGREGLGTWNGGFSPEVNGYSPGKLLLLEGIKRSITSGYREYDLMRGMEDYKNRWATGIRSIWNVSFSKEQILESKAAQ